MIFHFRKLSFLRLDFALFPLLLILHDPFGSQDVLPGRAISPLFGFSFPVFFCLHSRYLCESIPSTFFRVLTFLSISCAKGHPFSPVFPLPAGGSHCFFPTPLSLHHLRNGNRFLQFPASNLFRPQPSEEVPSACLDVFVNLRGGLNLLPRLDSLLLDILSWNGMVFGCLVYPPQPFSAVGSCRSAQYLHYCRPGTIVLLLFFREKGVSFWVRGRPCPHLLPRG